MKNKFLIVFFVLSFLFLGQTVSAAVITTCTQLQSMPLTGSHTLAADIDCSGISNFTPIGNLSVRFTGTFDGQGHTISGLRINSTSNFRGLFGFIGAGGTVKNVKLTGVNITGAGYTGGIAGQNNGTIDNCSVAGSITGRSYTGGIAGENYSLISNSYSSGTVSGGSYNYVGGLVGINRPGSVISNCYSWSVVTGASGVGGLAGRNENGTISASYSSGDVTGLNTLGGLVGYNDSGGNISYSFSSSDVNGSSNYIGGLVGSNAGGTIENVYARGDVNGNIYVGGLVGANTGSINKSYSSGDVDGNAAVGGLVGSNTGSGSVASSFWDINSSGQTSSSGGTAKTTAQMMQQSTFLGWDFVNIWIIDNGESYPYFSFGGGDGASYYNVWGWAWSENIGWINFNCYNDYNGDGIRENNCLPIDYGVKINGSTGVFSGYAWSENIGWISFNQKDLTGCPSGACQAKIDLDSASASYGHLSGWAKPMFTNKYEFFSGSTTSDSPIWGDVWEAQTFTLGTVGENESFRISKINAKIYRGSSNPGTLNVYIRAVDGSGHPTGSNLCSGSIDGNSLSTSNTGIWYEIFLSGSGCVLSPNTKYAVILSAPSATGGSSAVYWRCNLASDGYAGGNGELSTNGGSTWTSSSNKEYNFEVYGLTKNWVKLGGSIYDISLDSNDYASNGYSVFRGYGWGGGENNDEAIIGWVSFNGDNYPGGSNYSVKTDLAIASLVEANISCNPSSCSVFHGLSVPEILTLENNSTGTIAESRWLIKRLEQPDSSYIERDVCSGLCNFTPQNYIGSAWEDYGNYTAKLIIRNSAGTTDEATRNFELKRDANADFMCSIDDIDYRQCNEIILKEGYTLYLKGNDNSLPRYSWPSSSSAISTWNWRLDGVSFGGNNPSVSIDSFPLGGFTISLTVTDTAGRTAVRQYSLRSTLPLPIWKETAPF